MPQIQWGVPQFRTAETGVDRGVLYVEETDSGVAWTGLKRVERARPEEDLEPIFYDGNLVNLMRTNSPTTFRLETISTPREFMPCLGKVALSPGFYADNQPLKHFGLSYRTLVANNVKGLSYAYKIHIIFQAYASESPVVRRTVSARPEVTQKSYNIQTVPLVSDTYRPISYVSVSSESISPQSLQELEDLLYGTNSTNPRLPTISEIIDIIS